MLISAGRRRRSAFAAGLATMAMALALAAVPAEAAPPPKDVDYVAVGDSYSAGTGSSAPLGTFTTPPPCLQTHPRGYVDIVGATSPVTLVKNAACHGAFINWNDPNFNVPSVMQQIESVSADGQLSSDTELVSLTAGANDAGVNTVLFVCSTAPEAACKQAVAGAVKLMPAVGAGLVRAMAATHRSAPSAKIAVLGYPRLFDPTSPVSVIPPANQALVNQGTALLNATIAAAVGTANVFYRANAQYVDVTARFRGHAVNSVEPWIVLLPNPVPNDPTPDPRNFHPNEAGHRAYAEALTEAVNLRQLARR